jgi:hypothetical protein
VLAVGDRIPDARVWLGPRDELRMPTIVDEGAVLVFFYLFDWRKVNRKEQRGLERASGLDQHV